MKSRAHQDSTAIPVTTLDANWRFHRGELSLDQVWRSALQDEWDLVSLPHCINADDACDPDKPYFRGQGWYVTHLRLQNPFPSGRTLLHFGGAGQTTRVWAGKKFIGVHKGGYDEFSFDISDAARQFAGGSSDGIPLAICCDNSADLDRVPSDLSDFCLYGGLYRHVRVAYVPAIALDAVHILPTVSADGRANVSVKARLYNPAAGSASCAVSVKVFGPAGDEVHSSQRHAPAWKDFSQIAEFRLDAPQLWSPETPRLYRCRVLLETEHGVVELEERFGIRRYEFVEHGPFLLNGERVLLRGTQRHADHAGVAAAMSDDQVREEMKLIRDMGANFIRLAHYQQDQLVLDLCDELGLMVWEEAPWCRAGVGSEAFQANARQMLANMIDQHYNHPSIILWGLGNEDDWPEEYPRVDEAAIRQFMTEMRDLAHQRDGSRLTAFRRCEFARDIPDVYSPSIWAGWYRGDYHEYEQSLISQRSRVKRFLHAEWGADSLRGRHSENPEAVLNRVSVSAGTDERGHDYLKSGGEVRVSKDGDWSETYACNLFDWYLKTQEKLDWLTGSAQWIFKDFASPLRDDSDIPRVNMKGVVERDLSPKESYFVLQSYWAAKPMVHIYGHTWPVRSGAEGEAKTVRVYSNCESGELFVNGVSQGIRKRDSQDFPAAGLRWDVVFSKGPNKIRAVGHKSGVQAEDEIVVEYSTERWGAPAKLHLQETHREGNVVTLAAFANDADGRLCLDAAHPIRFKFSGAGKLLDNAGTSRASRALKLANGVARISLICNGISTVTANVEGIPSAAITFS
jgi:beta-galactosidase